MSKETKQVLRWIIFYALTVNYKPYAILGNEGVGGFIAAMSGIMAAVVSLYCMIRLTIWTIKTILNED